MLNVLRKPIAKKLIPIIFSFIVAGVCAWQLKTYLETKRPTEELLVAKHDIMPYTIITGNDLEYVTKPLGSRTEGAVNSPQEVVGKMAVVPLFRGEEIFPQKLIEIPLALTEDDRAIAIPVDVIRSVGLAVTPGSKVDLFRVRAVVGEREEVEYIAELLAENAVILDLLVQNKSYYSGEKPEGEGQQRSQHKDEMPNVAIIKIKADQVPEILKTIEREGFVYLVKRQ